MPRKQRTDTAAGELKSHRGAQADLPPFPTQYVSPLSESAQTLVEQIFNDTVSERASEFRSKAFVLGCAQYASFFIQRDLLMQQIRADGYLSEKGSRHPLLDSATYLSTLINGLAKSLKLFTDADVDQRTIDSQSRAEAKARGEQPQGTSNNKVFNIREMI